MSSNILVKRVCEQCGNVFKAKTTVTRFCSHKCNSRFQKMAKKNSKIERSNAETKEKIITPGTPINNKTATLDQKELIDIKVLSAITSIGERTLYRLIKEKDFPKLRIGTHILFHKKTVIEYLIKKYGNL